MKNSEGADIERQLIRKLMTGYDPAVRPVENSTDVLVVTFGSALSHIMDVVSIN